MTIPVLALLALIWLIPFVLLWRIPYPAGEGIPEQGGKTGSISVIIPARNEELTLPTLLESLRRQDTRIGEVIVVNDHSEDATAEISAQCGAS